MPGFRFSRERFQLPCDYPHKGGFALTVAAYKSYFLTPLYFHIRTRKNHFAGVSCRKLAAFVNHITCTRCRRELYPKGGIVGFIHLYAFQLGKRLNTALHLIALGGLVAERPYEVLCLGYHPLLILIGGHLLGKTLASQLHIFAVRHFIIVQTPEHQLDCAACNSIQKLPVVRNHQNGPFISL